jgi:hypothetical protein
MMAILEAVATVALGALALPVLAVVALVRLIREFGAVVRAVVWIAQVHRKGLRCPEGHVRRLALDDRWECSECHAVSLIPPYLPCPRCGDSASIPAWVPCDCSLAIPVPRIPGIVVRLMQPARSGGGHG